MNHRDVCSNRAPIRIVEKVAARSLGSFAQLCIMTTRNTGRYCIVMSTDDSLIAGIADI